MESNKLQSRHKTGKPCSKKSVHSKFHFVRRRKRGLVNPRMTDVFIERTENKWLLLIGNKMAVLSRKDTFNAEKEI